jgi:O-antigen/teichoic acid export membrane protein
VLGSILLIAAGAGVALLAEPTIRLMSAPAFHPAGAIVPVLILAYLFQAWTELVSTGLLVQERTGLIARANYLALGVALAAYALLVPMYGTSGAAWVTLGAFALRFALVYDSAQREMRIAYRWVEIRRATLACVLAVTVAVALPAQSLPLEFVARGLALLVAWIATWYLAIPDAAERRRFLSLVRHPSQLLSALGAE